MTKYGWYFSQHGCQCFFFNSWYKRATSLVGVGSNNVVLASGDRYIKKKKKGPILSKIPQFFLIPWSSYKQ